MPIEKIVADLGAFLTTHWLELTAGVFALLFVIVLLAAFWEPIQRVRERIRAYILNQVFDPADRHFPYQSNAALKRACDGRANAIDDYLQGRTRRRTVYAQRRRRRNDIDYEFVLTLPVDDPKMTEFIESPPSLRDFDTVHRGFVRTLDDLCGLFVRLLHERAGRETGAGALARVADAAILVDRRYRRTASSINSPESNEVAFDSRPFFDRIYLKTQTIMGATQHLVVIECEEGYERFFRHLLGGPKKKADRAWLGVGIAFARPVVNLASKQSATEQAAPIQCRAMKTRARGFVNGEIELRTPLPNGADANGESASIARRGAVSTSAAADAKCARVRVKQVRGDEVRVLNSPSLALLDVVLPSTCLDEGCQPYVVRNRNRMPRPIDVEPLIDGALASSALVSVKGRVTSAWRAEGDVGAWYDRRADIVQRFPSFRVPLANSSLGGISRARITAGQWMLSREGLLAGVAVVGHERARRDDFAIVHHAHWTKRYLAEAANVGFEAVGAGLFDALPQATAPLALQATNDVVFRIYE